MRETEYAMRNYLIIC